MRSSGFLLETRLKASFACCFEKPSCIKAPSASSTEPFFCPNIFIFPVSSKIIVIAFLDHLILAREHYEETLRQTTLLEEIRDGMQVFNRDNTPVETELLTLNPSS